MSPVSTTVSIRGLEPDDWVPGQPARVAGSKHREARVGHARARKIPAQLVEDEDYQLRYERVAGIDIGKAKADVCTRLPAVRDVPGLRRLARAARDADCLWDMSPFLSLAPGP